MNFDAALHACPVIKSHAQIIRFIEAAEAHKRVFAREREAMLSVEFELEGREAEVLVILFVVDNFLQEIVGRICNVVGKL